MAYENIKKLGAVAGDGRVASMKKSLAAGESKLNELLKKIDELESLAEAKRAEEVRKAEEAARLVREEEERAAAAVKAEEERRAAEQAAKEAEEQKKRESAAAATAQKSASEKAAEKPVQAVPPQRPAVSANPPRQQYTEQRRPQTGAPAQRPTFRPDNRPTRPQGAPVRPGQPGARPPYTNGPRPVGAPGARPPYRPGQPGARPFTGGPRPAAPAPLPAAPRRDAPKKFERTYVEQRRPVNKRALQRQQGVDIGDFDEDKSGYRKARFGKKTQKVVQTIKIDHAVVTSKDIPIKVLSEKLGISAVEITKKLFREGIMKTVNESIDYDNAAYIALELGIDLEYKPEKTAEETMFEEHGTDGAENLVMRAPVVTVMGHVDHGKTSLLDKIRATKVTEGEAGGITQSIGAYTVEFGEGKKITFIDTPGHAAFTAMRARGAKITDIVVLVVAADDGVMPQTVEAIDHAQAAEVPIIVAMNKMDKSEIDPSRVLTGLNEHGILPEEWGGDTIVVPVSAKTGDGIDALLENIWLVAEMRELRANPDRRAKGVVIEAKLDKGKGPMASVLVQNGTLHTGDNLVTGMTMGRVRAMFDDNGKPVKEAGPSTAVSVLGLEDVPGAGDAIFAVEQSLMKQVQEERRNKQRESMIQDSQKRTLEELFSGSGDLKQLKVVVKGDVQGSVEAVRVALEKLSNEEVQVKVIHAGAGAITESDISLADSAKAIVIGFNVRPDSKARTLAERSKVDVRSYRIIYELLDDMESALKGMLAPKYKEVYLGKAEVRETFNITGVGVVAGCLVTEGRLVRGGKLRIYRNDVMIVEGNVKQLKHYKDDVKEVASGVECGCAIENFNEIKIGDFIECYLIEEQRIS